MSDFESRLSAALADGAEDAPGVGGLADAARRRAVVRRRRRVSVAAVVAVVVAVVPVGVLAADRSDVDRRPSTATSTSTSNGTPAVEWRTVGLSGVDLDVPADWVAPDPTCNSVGNGWGPADAGACSPAVVAFPADRRGPAGDPDPGLAPGSASGSVRVGDVVVSTSPLAGVDHATVRRVLASARPAGTPAAGVESWETIDVGDGYLADAPVGGVVQVELNDGDVDCNPGPGTVRRRDDGRWFAGYCGSYRYVDVVGPTQALTDVVTQSVHPGPRTKWMAVTVKGLDLEVPSDWSLAECAQDVVRITPPGSSSCGADAAGVLLNGPSDFVFWPHLGQDSGLVLTNGQPVIVNDTSIETVRRILGSVRPEGAPAPYVASWRTLELEDGITAVVPGDRDVDVLVSGAIPSCTGERTAARRVPGGRWQVGLCQNHVVTVTAPTQALADLVALQVEGY